MDKRKKHTHRLSVCRTKPERLSDLAMDLVRLKVDLIMVSGGQPALAAKRATTTLPIVMANAGDPVASGLVASLGRPGGNVTGLSSLVPELNSKRLERYLRLSPQARPSWIFAPIGRRRPSRRSHNERDQACGSRPEDKIGGDRAEQAWMDKRKKHTHRKTKAGGRDNDHNW